MDCRRPAGRDADDLRLGACAGCWSEVKDLDAFCKKLAADGVTFESPLRDVPSIGLKIAFGLAGR